MPSEYRLILRHADQPGYTPDLECYLLHGGYEMLKKVLALQPREFPGGKKMSPQEQIRDEVLKSGLRGRGGAGFSCGLKWSFVDRKSGKPIYLICNADESEPGTFKDRQIIHKDPHQLLEGMIISCWANDVKLAYIYIRGEFVEGAKILQRAIREARVKNFLGRNFLGSGCDLEIYIHRGAGAYICGEETGLIESLEGKRAYPRIKPPYFPAVLGLYMCPTIVNNVETLCAVKHIVAMGSAEYATKRKGADGQMATVEVDLLELPYDFDSLAQAGSMSGSGAIIVMDDSTDIVDALANIAEFYAHESCGQCTPCREGSLWMSNALQRLTHGRGREQDADYLLQIAKNIQGRTICAFGEACAWPVLSFVNKFKDEFVARGAADERRGVVKGASPAVATETAASPRI